MSAVTPRCRALARAHAQLAVAGLLVLPACTAQEPPPAPTTSAPHSDEAHDHEPSEDGELATLGTVTSLTAADEEAAAERAEAFMTAFATTAQPSADWWADVQGHLTTAAAEEYAYVDPAAVPVTEVGRARLVRSDASPSLVRTSVRTDVGTYLVTLTRLGADEPWLVARADPPPEAR